MSASFPLRAPRRLSRREAWLAGAALLLLLLGVFAPVIAEPGAGNPPLSDFRSLMGLPNAVDVLSNLPFLIVGVLGLHRLNRLERCHEHHGHVPGSAHDELPGSALDSAWLFFAGLVLVSAASAFYHLQPDDVLRLAGDRAAMVVAFAGVMGLAVADRVSPRFGFPAACVTFAAGLLSVGVFHETGNVAPWAVVQFGGMALVLWMATLRPVRAATRPLNLKLGWIIAAYAAAKVVEVADAPIYEWTHHFVSGHSLKHVAAALAALPVLQSVRQLGERSVVHNSRAAAVTV